MHTHVTVVGQEGNLGKVLIFKFNSYMIFNITYKYNETATFGINNSKKS